MSHTQVGRWRSGEALPMPHVLQAIALALNLPYDLVARKAGYEMPKRPGPERSPVIMVPIVPWTAAASPDKGEVLDWTYAMPKPKMASPEIFAVTVRGKGMRERRIPVSPEVMRALRRYLARRGHQDEPTLFLNDDGSPMSDNALSMLMKRLSARSGVAGAHTHQFRHTYGTAMAQVVQAPVLQSLMGHSSIQTSMIYVDHEMVQQGAGHLSVIGLMRKGK